MCVIKIAICVRGHIRPERGQLKLYHVLMYDGRLTFIRWVDTCGRRSLVIIECYPLTLSYSLFSFENLGDGNKWEISYHVLQSTVMRKQISFWVAVNALSPFITMWEQLPCDALFMLFRDNRINSSEIDQGDCIRTIVLFNLGILMWNTCKYNYKYRYL